MRAEQVHPNRVISAVEPWSSKVVRVDARAEAITLHRNSAITTRRTVKIASYRISGNTHILRPAGHVEFECLAVVYGVANTHLAVA